LEPRKSDERSCSAPNSGKRPQKQIPKQNFFKDFKAAQDITLNKIYKRTTVLNSLNLAWDIKQCLTRDGRAKREKLDGKERDDQERPKSRRDGQRKPVPQK
jgi:hypothetical protein